MLVPKVCREPRVHKAFRVQLVMSVRRGFKAHRVYKVL
jgi:hypothetical protein